MSPKFRHASILLCLLIPLSLFSQRETAIWYFGDRAGLDFNSGVPVPLLNSAMYAGEGCSAISNSNGDLLFYTNGVRVWNRNHQIMPNGDGLQGSPSSTQSGIIVPLPESATLYYLFTVKDVGRDPGFSYSIVDMALDGGLGDVTAQKNVQLAPRVSEKLTAVQHANGRDYWVMVHEYGSSRFLAYLVSPAGVSTNPVVSDIGFEHFADESFYAVGYLKFSPDGTKLASGINSLGTELFDFDAGTGVVSNGRILREHTDGSGNISYYGVEFSPDSRFVYFSEYDFVKSDIYQFDTSAIDVVSTETKVYDGNDHPSTFIGALQLALDGKIYFTHFNEAFLGAIQNPNEQGLASNTVFNEVDLNGRVNQYGLPPFIQSYFLVSFEANNLCFGDATEFKVNSTDTIVSVLWDFGDGNTSNLENPSHTYSATGTYIVNVTVETATETKTETKEITISPLPVANPISDVEVCYYGDDYILDLTSKDVEVLGSQDPSEFVVSYHSNQDDANANINGLASQYSPLESNETIYARVSTNGESGCFAVTSFQLVVKEAPQLNQSGIWLVCDDDGDGLHNFFLPDKDGDILSGQDGSKFSISYHGSLSDAENDVNALGPNYTNVNTIETLFFRIYNDSYPECFEVGSFDIEVLEQVLAYEPNNIETCDDNNDGKAVFDLTQVEGQVLGGQDASNLLVSYHETENDALGYTNSLPPTNYFSDSYQRTVYVRVSNTRNPDCFSYTSFQLRIFDTPVAIEIPDWFVCDDDNDGQYVVDLNEKADEILSGVSGVSISFYESEQDAVLSQNNLSGTYQNGTNPQKIHVRFENQDNPHCFTLGSFEFEVLNSPTANQPENIIICDTEEIGSYGFDFSQKDSEVLGNQSQDEYLVTYHASAEEAEINENPLPKSGYQNENGQETIFVRVGHIKSDNCYDITNFSLIVNPLPNPQLENQYIVCPDSPDLTIDGGDFESWIWRNSEGEIIGDERSLSVIDLGAYSLTVALTQNNLTCEKTMEFEVISSGAPESLEVETSGLSDRITITAEAAGIGNFEYSIDGINFQSGNKFEVFPGTYEIFVRDVHACRTISKEVVAMGFQRFFTPNGDGYNENWNIIGGEAFPDSSLYIFDRYGKLIGQIALEGPGWDGTYMGRPLPASDYWFKYVYDGGKVFTGHFALKR